ncbi:hypothetical protein, partial [Pseudoxanthomonas taiwanensis]|uniref:hypothetical protein n=1 Tax=Pseudoxanthomonas taiwanensis TaxID=176598 RepID=UPI00138A477A
LWLAPALPALAASARLDGLPLLQRFGQGQLPGAPSYSAAGVDSEGTLYVGSSGGVMVYRSGDWGWSRCRAGPGTIRCWWLRATGCSWPAWACSGACTSCPTGASASRT